ncbi:damage-control phosphatase ARMT1 family protein [Methanolobus psychrotolerans]|uniref:damage-control phosphatase ARMT1 family protein n=1 Tax=Methanolobus psychrotolerans TaxID=1874706 RepID=UPI000B91BAD7|nr:ARMT1-like domain-containing protein [Methanolobus psychrotolerans]
MKVHPRCSYCLLSRVHLEAEQSTDDEELMHKAIIGGIEVMNSIYRPGMPAAELSTAIHRKAYAILNDNDPYRKMKELSSNTAARFLPVIRSHVFNGDGDDVATFKRAVLAAVIGNYFDYGVMGLDVPIDVFEDTFREHFRRGLDIDDTDRMLDKLSNVVYLADNCGEILIDTLVFEIIKKMGGNITLVVRGAPILNDVTMDEVKEFNIGEKVDRVLTTGSNAIGVCLEEAPQELKEALENASLIISKGMANYETLSEESYSPIAYLLKVKCDPVGEDIGAPKGCSVARLIE